MVEKQKQFTSQFIISILDNLKNNGELLDMFSQDENGNWCYKTSETAEGQFIKDQANAYQTEWFRLERGSIIDNVSQILRKNTTISLEDFIEEIQKCKNNRWSIRELSEDEDKELGQILSTVTIDNISVTAQNLSDVLLKNEIIQRVKHGENIIVDRNSRLTNEKNTGENNASATVIWEAICFFKSLGINFNEYYASNYRISNLMTVITHSEWSKRNSWDNLSYLPVNLLSLYEEHKDLMPMFSYLSHITTPTDIIEELSAAINDLPLSSSTEKAQATFLTAQRVIKSKNTVQEFLQPEVVPINTQIIDKIIKMIQQIELDFYLTIHTPEKVLDILESMRQDAKIDKHLEDYIEYVKNKIQNILKNQTQEFIQSLDESEIDEEKFNELSVYLKAVRESGETLTTEDLKRKIDEINSRSK